jgi:hypothetical protein
LKARFEWVRTNEIGDHGGTVGAEMVDDSVTGEGEGIVSFVFESFSYGNRGDIGLGEGTGQREGPGHVNWARTLA